MATKILPHNFIELIDASIDYLRGRKVDIYPDFPHGGMADFSNYNEGIRGGKVRIRANIIKQDNKTLRIDEIPFGTTTDTLIDSIVKATEKGKIKIKKVEDNTAAEAEILIHLAPGISPDKTIDALYAFTSCEVSVSPNAVTIFDNKPIFVGVNDLLKRSTDRTVDLLEQELKIKLGELQNQWHWSSLEKIFIEKRIYRDIEEEETWEGVISAIDNGLKPHIAHLLRPVLEEDIVRLTEIKIKRISKFDSFKADEIIAKIEAQIEEVKNYLDNLIQFAVDFFKDLKDNYGAGRERKTEIRTFDNINASKVIVSNKKLYVDFEEGFIGHSMRGGEFISDCSEIDDVIIFFETGKMLVTKVADKKFVGKGILHASVWRKGDKRTIYHLIYEDGKDKASYMKRFNVSSITRDNEYDLTQGNKGSKVHYFSCNPNGRKEVVTVKLRPRPHLKKVKFDIDFEEVLIKGRASKGNRATKEIISKVEQKETGGSTLAARKVWWDDIVRRLNDEGRGKFLGQFKGEDKILTLHQSGVYKLSGFELSTKFDDDMISIEKWEEERPVAAVYFHPDKDIYFVKRFLVESSSKKVSFIPDEEGCQLIVASTQYIPRINVEYNKRLKETKNLPDKVVEINEIIDVKGLKAQGNQLTKLKVKEITLLPTKDGEEWPVVEKVTIPSEEEDENNDLQNEDLNSEDSANDEDILDEIEEQEKEKEDDVDDIEEEEEEEEEEEQEEKQPKEKAKKVEKEVVAPIKEKPTPPKKEEPVKTTEDEKPIEVEWDITPSKTDIEKEVEEDKVDPNAKKKKNNPIKDSDKDDDQMSLF